MRSVSLRFRVAAPAAALALPLAGLAVAAPAQAADDPVISIDKTTFAAGDWDGGFTVTGSGFDDSVPVMVSIGGMGEQGGGVIYWVDVDTDGAGNIDEHVTPDVALVAPNDKGYPEYVVSASQHLDDDTYIRANSIDLTITPGTSAESPTTGSPSQFSDGITVDFSGFGPGEQVDFSAVLLGTDGPDEEPSATGSTQADADGNGSVKVAVDGLSVDQFVRVTLSGADTQRIASVGIVVVSEDDAATDDEDTSNENTSDENTSDEKDAGAAASGDDTSKGDPQPELAETGSDAVSAAIGGGMLLLAGAVLLLVRRRLASH